MTTKELHEQRMGALAQGNEIRYWRADFKRRVASGEVSPKTVADMILNDAEEIRTMRVLELLKALPAVGATKANRMCLAVASLRTGIGNPCGRRVGQLSMRQRLGLSAQVRKRDI
jgi:hypothetical protein